ncbi:hypothetical protein HK405_003916 [Cladochytrium tenue]|nr:hypothetical protein HK405_003916 [Cladochytrium tenue]
MQALPPPPPFVVLVTGCSDGGIGCSLARAFATTNAAPPPPATMRTGMASSLWPLSFLLRTLFMLGGTPSSPRRKVLVFATARRIDSMASLADLPNVTRLVLDVDSDTSIASAVARVRDDAGRIDLLINNAGIPCYGALLDVPTERLRQLFETNLFGALALSRAALPVMLRQRAEKDGKAADVPAARILNIGSVVGSLVVPFSGAYSASKAALHAASDALRLELRPLSISVCAVRPAAIASNFAGTATHGLVYDPATTRFGLYEAAIRARARDFQKENPTPSDEFARKIVELAFAPGYLPAYFTYGAHSWSFFVALMLPRWLSERLILRRARIWPPPQ